MSDPVTITDSQIQTIIAAIKSSGWEWKQTIPIFLASFLGMAVGIFMEYFKSSREKEKTERERKEKEVKQTNAAIVGIAYNIEILLTVAAQNIIPHLMHSHAAYGALQEAIRRKMVKEFAESLDRFPAMTTTCPLLHFIETDFLKDLPFLVQEDPELVKQSAWLVARSRELTSATRDRNANIETSKNVADQGPLNLLKLEGMIHVQASRSNVECVTALHLFELLTDIAKRLEKINETYKVSVPKKKLIAPKAVAEVMKQLKEIQDQILPTLPTKVETEPPKGQDAGLAP